METLIDFITGTEVYDTPAERVIQQLSEWLVSIGYGKGQIQTHPKHQLFERGWKHPRHLDLAVFSGEGRANQDMLIVAECKKSKENGYLNLERMRECLRGSGSKIGIWFDGTDLTYIVDVPNSFVAADSKTDIRFGDYIRQRREAHFARNTEDFSLRKVAKRVDIEPSRLSRIESNKLPPPDDETIEKLSRELQEDGPDKLMRLAHRVPRDVQRTILLRPGVMVPLIRSLANAPESVIVELMGKTKVRDGNW